MSLLLALNVKVIIVMKYFLPNVPHVKMIYFCGKVPVSKVRNQQ